MATAPGKVPDIVSGDGGEFDDNAMVEAAFSLLRAQYERADPSPYCVCYRLFARYPSALAVRAIVRAVRFYHGTEHELFRVGVMVDGVRAAQEAGCAPTVFLAIWASGLEDSSGSVRMAARDSFVQQGQDSVPMLGVLSKSDNGIVRELADQALKQIQEERPRSETD